MKVGIIGRKVGMTRVYDEAGKLIPVTVVDASGCVITQVKTQEKDGYSALQVGIGQRKPQNVKKALAGHSKKAGTPAKAVMKEIPLESDEAAADLKAGTTLNVTMFAKGDPVDVTGTSKGKGFAGVMKRHGYAGTKASHGVHEFFRHGGSIGATTWPGRVLKNVGMPGQLGNVKRTVQNVEIVDIKPKEQLLLLKGAIPGSKTGVLFIQSAKKRPAPKDRKWT